jgi:transposase InsO family protein
VHGVPHKKATSISTFGEEIALALDGLRCQGDYQHAHVIGDPKTTAAAGIYPAGLAKTLVDGVEAQFVREHRTLQEVLVVDDDEEPLDINHPDANKAINPWGDTDSEEELIEDKQVKVSAGVKAAAKRLHDATGHRGNPRLARALVLACAPPEVVQAAKHHKRALCDEKRPPKSRRPASLPKLRDVSHQVHIDVVELVDSFDRKYYAVHATDWVTRFQMAKLLKHKSSDEIIMFLREQWLPILGPPRVLVADQGREFISSAFESFCSEHAILVWHSAVQAPWQNGVCERGGGVLKVIMTTLVQKHSVVKFEEMEATWPKQSPLTTTTSMNLGVSPAQAALGKQPRMLGDVLGGFHQRLAEHGLADQVPHLARRLALGDSEGGYAETAFFPCNQHGELARSRSSTQSQTLEPGMIVFFWRESKNNPRSSHSRHKLLLRRWHGPALLIALEGHANAFVSFKVR